MEINEAAQSSHGRNWKRLIFGCVVVALAVCGAAIYSRFESEQAVTATAQPTVPVIATTVQQHDVPIVLTGLGTVTALNTATIRSQITGTLISVNFREGQSVKKGDLLAQIDPRIYQAQLDQAQAALDRDQAHLTNAQTNLNRYIPLQKEGFAPDQQVAGQQSAVAEQQSQIKADQAAIASAKTELSYTSLVAPFDGVTGLRLLDVGNIIRSSGSTAQSSSGNGDALVVVTQIQPISVIFTLATNEIMNVQSALAKGAVTALAFSQDGKTQLDVGQLLVVDNQADPTSGTVRLKAEFQNLGHRLWPGTFVNVQLTITVQHDGLTLPLAAIQEGPQGQFVFVVGSDRRVSVRPVSIRQTLNGEALIETGVNAGETVVTQGQYRLTPGAAVTLTDVNAPGGVSNSSTASAGMLP